MEKESWTGELQLGMSAWALAPGTDWRRRVTNLRKTVCPNPSRGFRAPRWLAEIGAGDVTILDGGSNRDVLLGNNFSVGVLTVSVFHPPSR